MDDDEYDEEGEEGEEEWESEDSWESDVDSEAEIAEIMQLDLAEETQQSGKQEYLMKCNELKIVPVAMFIAKLECEHVNLRHHGMGVKGAICMSAALIVNQKIRSLNLSDNWFGNEGVHALAEVLANNTTLTSINLSENRVGLPGARSLCRRLQENNTLAELNLKGNNLDDRAAAPLSEALKNSTSLTKVDLSYNSFGEAAGALFGDMLSGHSHLLEVNFKWNAFKAKGAVAVAEGLKNNQVLNKVDLGWNGLGDKGTVALGDMLSNNSSITHLDVSHNRICLEGALALSEGIKANQNLLSLELGFNPMGIQQGMVSDITGVQAIVEALKNNGNLETVGLTNVSYVGNRGGRASRFDPKNPDGHYSLDLASPWDKFLAETLYDRMMDEGGESWINVSLDYNSIDVLKGGSRWEMPSKGLLEFDYVTWKRGLEATFKLDLANPCELFIAEQLFAKTAAAESEGGNEALRDCRLDNTPLEPGSELPAQGMLHVVYFSTAPKDEVDFDLKLELAAPNDRVMCQRLWERVLTTPSDTWKEAKLNGEAFHLSAWQYPQVPTEGALTFKYCVRLAIKPYDRGQHFTPPMDAVSFKALEETMTSGDAVSDFDKVHLVKQAALRNYFTAHQVKVLLDIISLRKGKLEAAVLLHARMVDQHNFVNVLQGLSSEADRMAVMDMVESSGKGKRKKKR